MAIESGAKVVAVEQNSKYVPNLPSEKFTVRIIPVNDPRYVLLDGSCNADLYFVDSRRRAECIASVFNSCSDKAVLCLHDAQRARYHAALKQFPYVKFLTRTFCVASKSPEILKIDMPVLDRFSNLKLAHNGSEAWIFGKGPGLDSVDLSRAGRVRILLNEAVRVAPIVPSSSYWIITDSRVLPASNTIPDGCLGVFRRNYDNGKIAPCWPNVVHFYCTRELVSTDRDHLSEARELFGYKSSVTAAIHLAWFMGVSRVVLVGFSGRGSYSSLVRNAGARCDDCNLSRFLHIRAMSEILLRALPGWSWRFEGEGSWSSWGEKDRICDTHLARIVSRLKGGTSWLKAVRDVNLTGLLATMGFP
jgi:hypothetical protein